MAPRPRTLHASRGFTLIEIVVVLFIFAIVVGMAAALTRGVTAAQKRSLTAARMATVETALIQFVMQQRRLPCPTDGRIPGSDDKSGQEMRNAGTAAARDETCTLANQQHGVLPWRALALTEAEVMDGWDRRFTYRVHPDLIFDGGMDMSWCDPAGTQAPATPAVCSTTCTATNLGSCTPPVAFLRGRGLEIRNVAGTVLMNREAAPSTNLPTGAAFVVISHGETGGGGYLNTGVVAASTTTDGTEEQRNYANLAYTVNVTYFVDDTLIDVAGNTHFDDIVLRPSIMSVATKAALGPRSH